MRNQGPTRKSEKMNGGFTHGIYDLGKSRKAKTIQVLQLVVFLRLIVRVTSLLIYLRSKSLPGIDWDVVKDKGNAYECGYSDLSELRCLYSLQFYVIGLSFMIFDLEVLLILPILVSLATLQYSILLARGFLGFILVLLFLEIKVRVLDW